MSLYGYPTRALPCLFGILLPLLLQGAAVPDFTGSRYEANSRPQVALPTDWDGDGIPDILVINRSSADFSLGAVHLLPGNGDGTFGAPVRLLDGVANFAPDNGLSADLNQDGVSDLLVANTFTGSEATALFLNSVESPGTLSASGNLPTGFSHVLADFDGNGFPDLASLTTEVVGDLQQGTVEVYLNAGNSGGGWSGFGSPQSFDGTFDPGPAEARAGAALAVGDIDGDGDLDIVSDTLTLLNDGAGNFSGSLLAVPLAESPLFLASGEPGLPDVLVQAVLDGDGPPSPDPARLQFYDWDPESGSWSLRQELALGELSAFDIQVNEADLSGDGIPDLILGAGSQLLLLCREADLAFTPAIFRDETGSPVPLAYTGQPRALDLDLDGDLDLVTPYAGTQFQELSAVDVQILELASIRIRAQVFLDRNQNAVFPEFGAVDPTEPDTGVRGLSVTLRHPDGSVFLESTTAPQDLNEDGQADPVLEGGAAVFQFSGLEQGTYRLKVEPDSPSLVSAVAEPGIEIEVLPGDALDFVLGLFLDPEGEGADLGDLPEAATNFKTALETGPVHFSAGDAADAVWLGEAVDFGDSFQGEAPQGNALDDDLDGVDDEDGVRFPEAFVVDAETRLLLNNRERPGFANVWVDLDQNGTLEPAEWVVENEPLAAAPYTEVSFIPTAAATLAPSGTVLQDLHVRVRVSPFALLDPDEAVVGGEVEDSSFRGLDFGDAPDTAGRYPVFAASNGASHPLLEPLYLGDGVEPESDAQVSDAADGDTNPAGSEENGVVFNSPMEVGGAAQLEVRFAGSGLLQAWLDFNGDGDWSDGGEQVLLDFPLNGEEPALPEIVIPANAEPGLTFARFRLSTEPGLAPTGPALNGEVEDYRIRIFTTNDLPLLEILEDYTPVENGWREVTWFGFYLPLPSGWIYHHKLGPVWPSSAGSQGVFLYLDGMGWLFTNKEAFPYCYSYLLDSYVFFYRFGDRPDRFFYVFEGNNPGWRNFPIQ